MPDAFTIVSDISTTSGLSLSSTACAKKGSSNSIIDIDLRFFIQYWVF
ncbi:MAG: hypothetical protein ACI936_003449 [Paraglaciecola sp.]